MIELALQILCPGSLKDRRVGHRLLELFASFIPEYYPEKCGDSEVLTHSLAPNSLESALSQWGKFTFIAKRRRPAMTLQTMFLSPRSEPLHSTIAILRLQAANWSHVDRVARFLYAASNAFNADYGVLHILTEAEFQAELAHRSQWKLEPKRAAAQADANELLRKRCEREGVAPVLWGMTVAQHNSSRLRKCLPNLLWVTVFGTPYIELFGKRKLLSAPAHRTQELENGAVVLQLTSTVCDSSEDWLRYKSARDSCKEYLGDDAFLRDPANGSATCRVPTFRFPDNMYARDGSRDKKTARVIVLRGDE